MTDGALTLLDVLRRIAYSAVRLLCLGKRDDSAGVKLCQSPSVHMVMSNGHCNPSSEFNLGWDIRTPSGRYERSPSPESSDVLMNLVLSRACLTTQFSFVKRTISERDVLCTIEITAFLVFHRGPPSGIKGDRTGSESAVYGRLPSTDSLVFLFFN